MTTITKIIAKLSAVATIAATAALPFAASAAEIAPVSAGVSPWVVTTLAKDAGNVRIEAYKVDKNLVAWTEIEGDTRKLYAYDSTQLRLLAAFDKNDWKDDGNGYYEAVSGNFDVADGLVVWTMTDGNDREIYSFNGDAVKKVSDNSYDDRHPITSAGRVAWTSAPSAAAYNLMVSDRYGLRRVDAWPALNYAFSGSNLFWLNTRPNEPWMHVIVNSGLATSAIGQADDRAMSKYFFTDGKGNVAWEYSTKNWSYDKRIVYVSLGGANATQVIQRDVPPMVTRVEDMDGGKVMINITDLLVTDYLRKSTLLEITNGYIQDAVFRKEMDSKVRYMDGGYVRHREPGANTPIIFHSSDNGFDDFISLDAVILDRFDADGSAAAGARVGGGLVTYVEGKSVTIASDVETASVAVKNGNVAWIEGQSGNQTLKFATTTIVVRSGDTAKAVAGSLVKSPKNAAVYFAGNDGKRYTFPSESQYFSWFRDFSGVRTVSEAKLASMPLGGNVLYKPGTRLLKVASSPRIYSIGKDGSVHWLQSEELVVSLYGKYWTNQVTVIPETAFADYPQGNAVNNSLAFSATK